MGEMFLESCVSILILMCLALPGYILVKAKILSKEHIQPLVTVLLYVCQPFIMVKSFLTKQYDTELLANMGIVFLVAAVTQLAAFGIARLIFSYDDDKARRGVHIFSTAVGNVGFIGIPICQIFIQDPMQYTEAVLYISVYLVAFNLISWTLGAYMVTGDKKYISIKKALINPPMLALVVALPLFFAGVILPSDHIGTRCIGYIADMNTPLAMIVLGMRFALVKFTDVFKGWSTYLVTFLKLIATPLLVYACLFALNLSPVLLKTIIIVSAMPTANMVLMMAEKFGGDTEASVRCIMNTTIFTIATLPLIMLLPM